MLFNRLGPYIEPLLIPQQAGFRPDKSCTDQILNLTQHIEDGFELGYNPREACIDLSATYDRIMINKPYHLTQDYELTKMIEAAQQNCRFFVEFQGRKTLWRTQKNRLPQRSVLSQTIFSIYTNNQPQPHRSRSFLYADDLALAIQGKTFEEVEDLLTKGLQELASCYKKSHLQPNPTKTQVCTFHLRNKDAWRRLRVDWEGSRLEDCFTPKYLGVTLDCALTYKQHCTNTTLNCCSQQHPYKTHK
ncbi:hypothetical protein J437_LFUL017190 [Ladona fulva]|uniref:Reverse transcriptase domain-containing protein n=1 Tax=Ladona fulva TaxID=123851 RepID=A0A8K0KM10_LADFU|nr:hypothetical protein J437_LFUL017190 [Ladona fulva]